jgi:hypothetical protein
MKIVKGGVDKGGLTGYTRTMPKRSPDVSDTEHLKLLGVKISADTLDEIEQIRKKEKRTKSQVGALLLLRGLKLYREDGVLLEEESAASGRKQR